MPFGVSPGDSGESGGDGEFDWNPSVRRILHLFLAVELESFDFAFSDGLMGVEGLSSGNNCPAGNLAFPTGAVVALRLMSPSSAYNMPGGGTTASFLRIISLLPGAGRLGFVDGSAISPFSAFSLSLV